MRKLSDNRFDSYRVPHVMGPVPPELADYAGQFHIPVRTKLGSHMQTETLRVIVSKAGSVWGRERGADWDHVSVSLSNRCPTWEEMCLVKDLFFYPNETVMQLHPGDHVPYINNHPYCLHLWKPASEDIPLPPSELVGYEEMNR